MGYELPERQQKIADTAKEYLNKILSQEIKDSLPGHLPIKIIQDRSWTDTDNIIRLDIKANINTLIHETGHNLEFKNPKIKKAVNDYLDRRTAGEKAQKLSDVTGIKSYRDDELLSRINLLILYRENLP